MNIMKMDVVKEFDNRLLKRKEIEVSNQYSSNPGLSRVLEDITKHLNVKEEVVVIKKINSYFGSNNFLIDAFIYDSSADKERVEPKKKEKKEKKK